MFPNSRVINFFILVNVFIISIFWQDEVRGEFRVTPSISIREQYDSNIDSVSISEGTRSDYETSISPQLEVISENVGLQLMGQYRMNTRFYNSDSDLNYVSHSLSINMNKPLSERTTFSISDNLNHTKDSLDVEEVTLQTRRGWIKNNSASISMNHQLTRRNSVALTVSNRITKYDDLQLFDTRTDVATVLNSYQWTSELSTSASYAYSIYAFDDNENTSDFKSQSVSSSISYMKTFSSTVSVNVSGGLTYISRNDDSDDSLNFISNAVLDKRYQRSSFSIAYSRGVSGASSLSRDLNIQETLSFQIGNALSSSLNFGITGSVSNNRPDSAENNDVTTYAAGLNGTWQPYSWMNIGFGFSHTKQKSEVFFVDDVERETVYFNLSASYLNWRY